MTDDTQTPAQQELQEPLLPVPSKDAALTTKAAPSFVRLQVLCFLTGVVVTVVSQVLLGATLWQEEHHHSAHALAVVLFSGLWSILTCLLQFVGMLIFFGLSRPAFGMHYSDSHDEYNDARFSLEAHYIVGALLCTTIAYFVLDVISYPQHPYAHLAAALAASPGTVATVTMEGLAAYLTLWYVLTRPLMMTTATTTTPPPEPVNMMHTYQLVALSLGAVMGTCSQLLLSFVLWDVRTGHFRLVVTTYSSNIIVLSMVWSMATVALTFAGCRGLRVLLNPHDRVVTRERFLLRMEACYIGASFVGITAAWIVMDVLLGHVQHVLPSLGLLVVSLLAFAAILLAFPEQQCLDEIVQQEEEQHEGALLPAETV